MKQARLLLAVAPLWLGCSKGARGGLAYQSEASPAPAAALPHGSAPASSDGSPSTCQDVQATYKALTEDPSRAQCSVAGPPVRRQPHLQRHHRELQRR